ncbi:MAG: 50S ribosomal protein L34 [Candidatus Omnitrophota bacterium]
MKKHLKTPSNITGKRVHGFRRRMRSHQGRMILKRRRRKARSRLCI